MTDTTDNTVTTRQRHIAEKRKRQAMVLAKLRQRHQDAVEALADADLLISEMENAWGLTEAEMDAGDAAVKDMPLTAVLGVSDDRPRRRRDHTHGQHAHCVARRRRVARDRFYSLDVKREGGSDEA
jgi:hypothetical protein